MVVAVGDGQLGLPVCDCHSRWTVEREKEGER